MNIQTFVCYTWISPVWDNKRLFLFYSQNSVWSSVTIQHTFLYLNNRNELNSECGGHLVAEADGELAEWHGVRTVSSEEHLQLDGLVHMEAGRLEPGFALDWCERKKSNTWDTELPYMLLTVTQTYRAAQNYSYLLKLGVVIVNQTESYWSFFF